MSEVTAFEIEVDSKLVTVTPTFAGWVIGYDHIKAVPYVGARPDSTVIRALIVAYDAGERMGKELGRLQLKSDFKRLLDL